MSFIVKKSHNIIPSIILPALLLLGFASACNKKEDPDPDYIVVTPATVAVTNFNLKADTKVLTNLDSVFFSIDLNKGVIFNADSLPVGTRVRRLIPVITFANSMSAAEIVYTDSTGTQQTVNYLETQTDSIDFTNEVLLNVTAADGENKYTYRIKVNVHKQKPDSLMWDNLAKTKLPSRNQNPAAQKTVMSNDKVYTLIEENNHTFTLAQSSDLYAGYSKAEEISLPFIPQTESLTATSEAFYILDTAGMLYTSPDMTTWTATGEDWESIIGTYLDCVLGIRNTDKGKMHCHYPASDLIADTAVASDFPVYGRSSLASISNKWSPLPTVFFVGGKTSSGETSNHTWAFDGSSWTTIDYNSLPALDGAMLVRYTAFRSTGRPFYEVAYDAWFAFGGNLSDGSSNRTLYYSLDNGVNWKAASELMQLPEYFPQLFGADALVIDTTLNANLSEIWTPTPSKAPKRWYRPTYEVDSDIITWDCPYIYVIGGYLPDGSLSDTIWRGVLSRLAFTPLI